VNTTPRLLAAALALALSPRAPSVAAEPLSTASKDERLLRAVTLDDYHPWQPYTDLGRWRERARRVREQVLVAAGLWPLPLNAPPYPVIHGKIERDEYTIEKVFFQSWPGFYVTGNLYRPKRKAEDLRPGVLSPHGHWQNGRFYENNEEAARKQIEKGAEKTLEGARYPLQARCAMLARMGCVVFHYDMVGNADSQQIGHAQGFRDVEAELRLQNAFGLQLYNSIRAFEFLAGLEGVDPHRIGVTGASGGGTQTFFLCAVDDRPAVSFPAVMVSTAMQGGCVCENASLLRVGTGNIELAALTAPRPQGMTGADDWTIDIETKGLPELKVLYGAFGVPALVDAKCYRQFDHNYNQVSRERMYSWMNRHLKLGFPEPVEERPFTPVPPRELSVFDAEHPRPAKALDAAGLRALMTETSNRQIELLTPRDGPTLAEFRRMIGGALRAMVVSELPAAGEVEAARASGEGSAEDRRRERLVLRRAGTAEAVPALWIAPEGWNGKVLVVVSPGGKKDVEPGGSLAGVAAAALAARAAVLAPDVLLTGELVPPPSDEAPVGGGSTASVRLPVVKNHQDYAGYTYGYNRTLLANRVHDVLTAIAHARQVEGARAVHVLGTGDGGLWVLLAGALAGSAVERLAAERPAFDFADVKSVDDPRFLPGGVKYGGWGALAALNAPREVVLLGDGDVPPLLKAAYAAAGATDRLRQLPGAADPAAVARDLLR
jgi:dienelactone hydrolase